MPSRFLAVIFLLLATVFGYAQKIPAKPPGLNTALEQYIKDNEQKHVQELIDLVDIPCISSLPAHKADMMRAAEWLQKKMQSIGMSNAQVMPTDGHSVVFAEWNQAKGKPTYAGVRFTKRPAGLLYVT